MVPQAQIWRPLLIAAVTYGHWLALQSPARLESRSWVVYPILASLFAGCAAGAWGIQRARGRRWPWYGEMFAMLGLLAATALVFNVVLPLVYASS